MAIRIVGLSGSSSKPSRTRLVVEGALEAVTGRLSGAGATAVDLAEAWPHIGPAFHRSALGEEGRRLLGVVESADVLVVGTPVYRAASTGLLKHVLDLVDRDALRGKVAIATATGGTERHALALDYHLRPVLTALGLYTVPTAVFAHEREVDPVTGLSPELRERLARAAAEAAVLAGVLADLPAAGAR